MCVYNTFECKGKSRELRRNIFIIYLKEKKKLKLLCPEFSPQRRPDHGNEGSRFPMAAGGRREGFKGENTFIRAYVENPNYELKY